MEPIRVLLVDDHTLVRAGIRALLESLPGIEVVAEADDGRQALRLIEEFQPAVVLMDIAMPGLNGLEATAQIVQKFPQVQVIILSMYALEEYVLQAIQIGAAGYLLKDITPVELDLAIQAVMRGETYLCSRVSKYVTDYVRRVGLETGLSEQIPLYRQLTLRQREILQLIAEGRTTQDIANMLKISVKTVESHRLQLMKRLNIHHVAGLVRYAVRMGLVPPEE
jgi:DNA-binding NarL/FixJ family response regulator